MSKRAAIYCRISRDAEQEGLGVKRQEQDCRTLVKREGWSVVEVFTDNDISASRFSKKPRPRYDDMLEAARAHRVDVLVAYDNRRITRRMEELEDLVRLVEQTGVEIHTVASGNDNLATADGRMVARIKASIAAGESEKTAERLRRKFLEKAQNGAPGQGARGFGWAEDKVSLHPKESRLLRRAVQDVIDGVPTREIARRWNAAGLTTVPKRVRGDDGDWLRDEDGAYVLRGNPWDHSNVRQVLRNPRLCGYRVHQRAERARAARRAGRALTWRETVARDADGAMVRGAWEPLVDDDTFDALQAALDGRQPRTRRGAQKYLLTGVARCKVCGARMHGARTRQGTHSYACDAEGSGHSLTIAGVQTDALVVALVERRLAEVDLSAEPVRADEWEGEARLRAIPAKIRELMEAFNSNVLSGAIVFPQVQALEAEQAALERDRPRAAPRPTAASADAFPTLDLDRRRAVVASLVDAVWVGPAERRGAAWTPDRLEVVWRA